jgi:hypothetical protein
MCLRRAPRLSARRPSRRPPPASIGADSHDALGDSRRDLVEQAGQPVSAGLASKSER